MDAAEIRAYMRRDWDAVASMKSDYWAERFRQDRLATWRASQAMLLHASRVGSSLATTGDRDADLDVHLRLRSILDRSAHAFPRR